MSNNNKSTQSNNTQQRAQEQIKRMKESTANLSKAVSSGTASMSSKSK
jgi:hypothetical protein